MNKFFLIILFFLVFLSGCSDSNIPEDAYIQLLKRLQTVAKSLFYGEACSSVPLWKANK